VVFPIYPRIFQRLRFFSTLLNEMILFFFIAGTMVGFKSERSRFRWCLELQRDATVHLPDFIGARKTGAGRKRSLIRGELCTPLSSPMTFSECRPSAFSHIDMWNSVHFLHRFLTSESSEVVEDVICPSIKAHLFRTGLSFFRPALLPLRC
jgi:hypothetical protein